jgi:hypothetical protein
MRSVLLRVTEAPPPPTLVTLEIYVVVVAASVVMLANSPALTPENGVPLAAVNTRVDESQPPLVLVTDGESLPPASAAVEPALQLLPDGFI